MGTKDLKEALTIGTGPKQYGRSFRASGKGWQRLALLGALVAVIGMEGCCEEGCVTYSVFPFYEDGESVFDPELVGTWRDPDEPSVQLSFDRAKVCSKLEGSSCKEVKELNHYSMTIEEVETGQKSTASDSTTEAGANDSVTEEEKSLDFKAHLVVIGSHRFLDITSWDAAELNLLGPLHFLYKVELNGDSLRLLPLDSDWLSAAIKKGQVSLRGRMGGDGDLVILTEPTEVLQRFVEEHADDEEAFLGGSVYERKREE